jgi:hypothetical protein
MEDLSVGSGSIIGKSNIEEFFNHISMHEKVEEKSWVKLAPSIEVASVYLIDMLETRFASLNPFVQYMFLKLHEIEDPKKKAFILETLHLEFKDVVIEARKVLIHFNKLGSPINVISTDDEGAEIPIPCKLLGLCEAFEKIILIGSVLKIFLMKIVYQSMITKGLLKLMWIKYNALLTRPLLLILILLLKILDSQFSAPSSKALKKSTLGR